MPKAPLELAGEERFSAPPEKLFDALTDVDLLAATIPDMQSCEKIDAGHLKCVVRPGFAFIRGTMKLDIELADLKRPQSATMRIAARGIGAEIDVESQFAIEADGAGSLMKWTGRVARMKGLVATVSPALVKAAAGQVLKSGWTQVRKQLGEGETA